MRATFHFVENYLSDDTSKKSSQKANSTARAYAECTFEAKGLGSRRLKTAITLPVWFAHEPHLVTGCGTVTNPDTDTFYDPVGQCGVYQWLTNAQGYYVGAYIWIKVSADQKSSTGATLDPATQTLAQAKAALAAKAKTQAKTAQMRTILYLTFSGRAVKDIGQPEKTNKVTPHTVAAFPAASDD